MAASIESPSNCARPAAPPSPYHKGDTAEQYPDWLLVQLHTLKEELYFHENNVTRHETRA